MPNFLRTLAFILALLTALSTLAQSELPGSLRNARAAHPVRAVNGPLIYLAGEVPDDDAAAIAEAAPGVKLIRNLTRETALEHAAGAHAIDAHLLTPEFLEKAPNLVWVQSRSAGVERYLALKGLVENDRIIFTNARGVHGPAIADHVFAMLLTLTRNLREYAAAQTRSEWSREAPEGHALVLKGRTMLIVGLGGIGNEVAQRARGFGMRIIGTRRSDTPSPEFIEHVGKPDDLLHMLPEADVVAICVPLTPETEGLFGDNAFAAMKPGAILINIARGKIVNAAALMKSLESGRLGGACLDVTDPEPLPENHPLWRMKNVVITPHVAADGELTDERAFDLLKENLRRFDADEPLLNVVDKRAGY